jgi:hypothetical protein
VEEEAEAELEKAGEEEAGEEEAGEEGEEGELEGAEWGEWALDDDDGRWMADTDPEGEEGEGGDAEGGHAVGDEGEGADAVVDAAAAPLEVAARGAPSTIDLTCDGEAVLPCAAPLMGSPALESVQKLRPAAQGPPPPPPPPRGGNEVVLGG